METNVVMETGKKGKKGKPKFEATGEDLPGNEAQPQTNGEEHVNGEEKEVKAKGAPRPRRWEYGIMDDAQLIRIAEAPTVRKDIEAAWDATEDNPTVAEYNSRVPGKSDARHGLRVMLRRGLIKLVQVNGDEYPRQIGEVTAKEPQE